MLCEYGCQTDSKYILNNGKRCCSESYKKCSAVVDKIIHTKRRIDIKKECIYCKKLIRSNSINRHESTCYLNPNNLKICSVCGKPVKDYKHTLTCSHSCANKLFKTGNNNGMHKKSPFYTTKCFNHHTKCCVVCGEINIVSVHHFDNNHKNNNVDLNI